MTVYVLTEGEHSGREIVGVFSSLEKITEFVAKNPRGLTSPWYWEPYNDPETYELDAAMALETGPTFLAWIHRPTGNLTIGKEAHLSRRHPRMCEESIVSGDTIEVRSPISFEHASKVATEMRQAWLRSQTVAGEA
ncbi:MAG TPA: hypothetical protein PLB88_04670 [Thermoanaerobaculaceae bacterium]|nr:hypothetical protein [Thermoanaerobaculaceae bacterium]